MPIDPSIPLGVRPAPFQSPLEAVTTITHLQGIREQTEARRLAADAARRKAAEVTAVQQIFADTGGDVQAALPRIRVVAPGLAPGIEKEWEAANKDRAETAVKTLELRKNQFNFGLQALQSGNDQNWPLVRQIVGTISPDALKLLPETYDQDRVNGVLKAGLSAKELNDTHLEGLRLYLEGKPYEALSRVLSTIDPADPQAATKWDQHLANGRALGIPAQVIADFGAYSPEAPARATQLGISPAKRAELAEKAQQPTEAAMDFEAQRILTKPVAERTPAEVASLNAYQARKTTVTDAAAAAAAVRLASTQAQQNALQARAQTFQEQQAGRKELTDKVETPYLTAQNSANTLRDVVAAAKAGNKVAGSLQALETTMAAIRAQGLNRINMPEIATTAQSGNLWDHIVGYIGKRVEGQPVPANIQQDMLQFAGILEKAAYKKYQDAHAATTKRYGLTEAPLPPPAASPTLETPSPTGAAPRIGERRMFNGQLGEWDGKGWKAVR